MRRFSAWKVIGSITLLFAVILAIGLYAHYSLKSSSQRLESKLNAVEENIRSGDMKSAGTSIQTLKADWKKTKRTWSILTDHIEIDNITTTLEKMGTYIEKGKDTDALAESTTLREYITHIPRKEALTLENVL